MNEYMLDILVAYDIRVQFCLNYNKCIFCLIFLVFLFLPVSMVKECADNLSLVNKCDYASGYI